MAGTLFCSLKIEGLCIDKETSSHSVVVGVRSENQFIDFIYSVWHRCAVTKFTAGQVTPNTKCKVNTNALQCIFSLIKNDCKSILNVHRFPISYRLFVMSAILELVGFTIVVCLAYTTNQFSLLTPASESLYAISITTFDVDFSRSFSIFNCRPFSILNCLTR